MVAIMIFEPDQADHERMQIALINADFTAQPFDDREIAIEVLERDPTGYALVIGDDPVFFNELNKNPNFDSIAKMSIGRSRNDMEQLVERVKKALHPPD